MPRADVRLAYGQEPSQFGDLRLPVGFGPHPCVVAIHGGFWRARYNLEHLGHLCQALTELGLATWSIEYRRVGEPGGGWPGTFRDVAAGADHLFRIAPEYGIDRTRVVVLGHSAGGHLAFWLAGLGGVPAGSAVHADPLPFRGAVALAGVLDLHRTWELGLSENAVVELLSGAPHDVPDRYAAASPAALLPLGLPQIIVHGVDDDLVPVEMSEGFCSEAVARGDAVTFLPLPGMGHFELIDPESAVWPSLAAEIVRLAQSEH